MGVLVAVLVLAAAALLWLQSMSAEDSGVADSPVTAGNGQTADADAVPTTTDAAAAPDEEDAETEGPRVNAEGATPIKNVASEVTPQQVAEDADAGELVDPVVRVRSDALVTPDSVDWDEVVSVAGGGLLSDIEASVLEYTENGWTQEGTPELVSSTVLELDQQADPPTALVEVCLDHSAVRVLDANGQSLTDESAAQRVPSVLSLAFQDDRWIAVGQAFTDESTC
ncbi:hypothetical protein BJF86_02425 [Serinicoccus sp. CNJ-927]|nr:hypothetical protein BJF86_02425 [Serinicoccus sp. CNJ-927]